MITDDDVRTYRWGKQPQSARPLRESSRFLSFPARLALIGGFSSFIISGYVLVIEFNVSSAYTLFGLSITCFVASIVYAIHSLSDALLPMLLSSSKFMSSAYLLAGFSSLIIAGHILAKEFDVASAYTLIGLSITCYFASIVSAINTLQKTLTKRMGDL